MGKNRGTPHTAPILIGAVLAVAVVVVAMLSYALPSAQRDNMVTAAIETFDKDGKLLQSLSTQPVSFAQSIFGGDTRVKVGTYLLPQGIWVDPQNSYKTVAYYRFIITVTTSGRDLVPNSPMTLGLSGKVERRDGALTNPATATTAFTGSWSIAKTSSTGTFEATKFYIVSHQMTTPIELVLSTFGGASVYTSLPDRSQVTSDKVFYVLVGSSTDATVSGGGWSKTATLGSQYYLEVNWYSGEIFLGITASGDPK